MNRLYFVVLVGFLLGTAGCGEGDVAFVNQVKTFEPRWQELYQQFSYVKRNLALTEDRYDSDLAQVQAFFEDVSADQAVQLRTLSNRYEDMVEERDRIREAYDETYQRLIQTVYDFNEWEKKLMDGEVGADEKEFEFAQYKNQHAKFENEITALQNDLIRNVDEHNSLMRRMTSIARIYTDFDLDMR